MPPSNQAVASREQRHFDQLARECGGSSWWYATQAGQRRLEIRAGRIAALCTARPARILEIGCGDGALTKRLLPHLERSVELVAVDLSAGLLRLMAGEPAYHNSGTRFLQGDVERLPFADSAFHTVIGNAILHHVSLEQVIPECLRVLRPGGQVIFTEPNLLNPYVFLMKRIPWIKRWLRESPDERAFVRWPLRRELARLGLCSLAVEPFDFVFPLLPAWLVDPAVWIGERCERIAGVREFAISLFITGRKPGSEAVDRYRRSG